MTDEAYLLVSDSDIRQVTVPAGTAIAKGQLIVLGADNNQGATHQGYNDEIPLGFAVTEKSATDTQTSIGVRCRGEVDAVATGDIVLGYLVCPSTVDNRVKSAGTTLSGITVHTVMGRCMETASDGERVRIKLLM